ncbi:MAG: RNA-binding protein [Candidatus Alcyoniella australis]|nr:RNA-binding protein [Candidatus Alcyoniella australis]
MAKKLYAGGLSWNTTDESLRDAFASHGEVTDAVVIKDRDSGRSRGFGFVTMADDDSAKSAVSALNGTSLDGRTIQVSEAREKSPRNDRDGGGGGGGGGRNRW